MQDNVREMPDDRLLKTLRGAFLIESQTVDDEQDVKDRCFDEFMPAADELTSRLTALRAEVEQLKAEAVVMRELCEAALDKREAQAGYIDESIGEREFYRRTHAYDVKLDAYRAMKGEKDAKNRQRNGRRV